jgi:hypothetical protein
MFYSYTRRRHPKISVMSYCTYPIKLQLFLLILPIAISALKGLVDLKKGEKGKEKREREKRKERGQKVPKEKKDNQVLILILGRYVIPKEKL